MHLEVRWNELARPFQACSLIGLAAGAVYLWFLGPLLVYSWFLNTPSPIGRLLFEAWTTAIIVAFMMVPLGGAIGLLTLPLSDQYRGIIALFVMIFSFIGIVVLATYALEYLLSLWPFALAAMIWIPLGWMAIKAARNNGGKKQ